MKDWKPFNDECTTCGGIDVWVLTNANEEGLAFDGDDAECITCGLKGYVCVDGENNNGDSIAHISWNIEY